MHNKIKILQGDITKVTVDAIVNAANTSLLGGGGVDGAIHRAGGSAILDECQQIRSRQGGCKVGDAVITTAGNLPAKYVIHTVGPHWNGGNNHEAELLAACYIHSFALARQHRIESIAFPNISTGIYHYPKKQAAEIAFATIVDCLKHSPNIKEVLVVCYEQDNYQLYQHLQDHYQQLAG